MCKILNLLLSLLDNIMFVCSVIVEPRKMLYLCIMVGSSTAIYSALIESFLEKREGWQVC